jgi:hypothetical protein
LHQYVDEFFLRHQVKGSRAKNAVSVKDQHTTSFVSTARSISWPIDTPGRFRSKIIARLLSSS